MIKSISASLFNVPLCAKLIVLLFQVNKKGWGLITVSASAPDEALLTCPRDKYPSLTFEVMAFENSTYAVSSNAGKADLII